MSLNYLFDNWQEIVNLAIEHLELTLIAILFALLIATPLGLIVTRFRFATLPVFGLLSAIYTIPSLAMLSFLIPSLGLGRDTAIVTLAAYAQIFLVRNIVAGLRGVDPSMIEAGRGMGMTGWQVFRSVQLPLAMPVVIAGLRIATVTTISLATITAWINAGGLGLLLFDGIARNNPSMILAGTIAITTLALVVDQLLRMVQRFTAVARAGRAASR